MLPTPPPDAFHFLPIVERSMSERKRKTPKSSLVNVPVANVMETT